MWWILLIVLAFLIPEVLSTILDSRLGRAVAQRIEGNGAGPQDRTVLDRMRYLEGEVDRLNEEVRRLHEEGEFLQRLLTERPASGAEARLPRGDPPD